MRGGRDETPEALAAMGLVLEDAADDACLVWPDNWRAVEVFAAMATQWRVAPSGNRYGLDYTALPAVCDLMRVDGDRTELFGSLRVMESEILERQQ